MKMALQDRTGVFSTARTLSSLEQVDSGETTDSGQEEQNENIKKAHAANQLKALATELGKKVCEDFYNKTFLNIIKDRFKGTTKKLDIFAKECVSIIWLMCVQDPPIFMEWVDNDDEIQFDSEKCRFYTKSGTKSDFCVWPVVYLSKKGLILLKGIAQGK